VAAPPDVSYRNVLEEEALTRLASLIEYGGGNIDYGTTDGNAHFFGWRAQAISALEGIIGEKHIYATEFKTRVNYQNGPAQGIEILRRLRSDIENGYLRKIANIISAEVFGDFLEMAEHFLAEGYKDPAVSLTGAVLEDGLRRIARNNDITVTDRDDLSSLRDKCVGRRVFTNLIRQQITVWTTLRNSADHGKFDEYSAGQVNSMISDVRSFLSTYLQ
jgi:hypothetical protein